MPHFPYEIPVLGSVGVVVASALAALVARKVIESRDQRGDFAPGLLQTRRRRVVAKTALRQPSGFFQAALVREGQSFLVLKQSLAFKFGLAFSSFPFHCRLVTPQKCDKVPAKRELNDFDFAL